MTRLAEKQLGKVSENRCPVCGSKQLAVFFQMPDVPVHCNVLWSSRDAALKCPKGDIKLAFCRVCSFITNLAFDQRRLEYTKAYENPLDFSPRFQVYSRSLAARLVRSCNLQNKSIIEIGCGKGHFLTLLCQLGKNRGVGFDPSYVPPEESGKADNRVKFIRDFYSERYANYKADLFVCRQTLEHMQNPKDLLSIVRDAIGNSLDTHVFFEVPNALQSFRKLFVWDIIYEHCSYFTPASLQLTFSSSGFRVRELTEEFEGQFLSVHALPSNQAEPHIDSTPKPEVKRIASDIASFSDNYENKVEACRQKLKQIESNGQRVVVWGAGSKGVSFLNTFRNSPQIEYAVDINPRKQGMHVAGTGQQIVPPGFLRGYQPDVIIVMNPIYTTEIRQLTRKLGLAPEFVYV